MFATKGLKFCRKQGHKLYLAGEHSTAFMYAVCEFIDAHIILVMASIVLIIGIFFIMLDQVLTWFGIPAE